MVDVQFTEWTCEVNVVDAEGTTHILKLGKLHEKIEAEKSKFRFSEGKRISVTLKKWLETKWDKLL